MTLQLQMIQKPPVVFSHYDPCTAISDSDLAYALKWSAFKEDAIARLWLSYSRNVLSDVDPCMEANDGAAATIAYTAHYESLKDMRVNHPERDCHELIVGNATLYLVEDEGDVFLYFLSPYRLCNRWENCRIDLSDYSSDASAYFIATVFEAYEHINRFYETLMI